MVERADAPLPEPRSTPAPLGAGTMLGGRYRIGAVIGRPGPHAIVYRGRGAGEETLVVKELCLPALVTRAAGSQALRSRNAESGQRMADAARRFLMEAQLLRSIEHPSLPRVRDVVEANGTGYLITEFVRGRSLDEAHDASRQMSPADARAAASTLLGALDALHAHGILHRDIAPDNVCVGTDRRARLFGLATPRQLLMDGGPGSTPPRAGFAPIEMYGSRSKGPWTDVYGVAALLYWMLTGTEPPSALDRAAGAALVPPARLVTGISWALDGLVVKALSQHPEDRPHSAERFRAMLDESVDVRTPPSGPMTTLVPAPQRAPVAVTSAPTSFPSAPAPLMDAEIEEGQAPGTLTTASGGGTAVVMPPVEAPRARRSIDRRWALAFAGTVVVLVAIVGIGQARSRLQELRSQEAWAAAERKVAKVDTVAPSPVVATRPVPPPAVSPQRVPGVVVLAGGDVGIGSSAGDGVGGAVAPAPARPRAKSTPRTPRRSTPRPPTSRSRSSSRIATASAPVDSLAQLQRGLAEARTRASNGEFSTAQRMIRLALAKARRLAARYPSSSAVASLRRQLEDAADRAREECDAYNLVARRRGSSEKLCG